MYVSKIRIIGFRNFKDTTIEFNDGINVIIGHNNSGKSNLLKALSLILDYDGSKRLVCDDFYKGISIEQLKTCPPIVTIHLTMQQSNDEDPFSDELAMVGAWLIRLESPYVAELTYEFYLPEEEKQVYIEAFSNVDDIKKGWLLIKEKFLRKYVYKIFGGNSTLRSTADGELLRKIDFQYLNAIRDVERDMFLGRSSLLHDVLDFFIDYEIKSNTETDEDDKKQAIDRKKAEFAAEADRLIALLQGRIRAGEGHILSYAHETGASFNNAKPGFDGNITDVELFSFLRLIIETSTGLTIPATHNGLGYNNLIFMSLLLAKMQANSDGKYFGSNAKVFAVLTIEEPEAHLHPAMQYKFLKFLRDNRDVKKKVHQIFVTSHSTQITAAVSLDEIICLHDDATSINIGYPAKTFSDDAEGNKSKNYVQRFLDSTKSDMLFANKIILVEGISEQLLIPVFARYCRINLEDHHTVVINVGGKYFEHYLNLFNSQRDFTINKKIACLIDLDPIRKLHTGRSFESCYPYEYDIDPTNFIYKNNYENSVLRYQNHPNIHFFCDNSPVGKTLEYNIAYLNPTFSGLLSESVMNSDELNELRQGIISDLPIEDFLNILRSTHENKRITESIRLSNWEKNEKMRSIFASRYLNSITKGQNATELAYEFETNRNAENRIEITIPLYIKDAIEWICE